MTYELNSSALKGGDPFFPQKVVIDDTIVEWSERSGFLYLFNTTKSIPRNKIIGVEINTYLIGCRISIHSYGFETIEADYFSVNDAKKIRTILIGNK